MHNEPEFQQRIKLWQQRVDQQLERWLPEADKTPSRLHQAMRYSVMSGGKRVRPILVYAIADAFDVPLQQVDGIACAVEIIHAYSLIHDDLPAMDDDDLRRGRPTCHKQFDEATAILAGDALQALAFFILGEDPGMTDNYRKRLQMISRLSRYSGSTGMAGGQAIDLESVGKTLTLESLTEMHKLKTGALIRTCIYMAALSSEKLEDADLDRLDQFASAIGLSFQVYDDILDIIGDTETLGKPQGSDQEKDKPTFPALLGLEKARMLSRELHQKALQALSIYGTNAETLRQISSWFISRKH